MPPATRARSCEIGGRSLPGADRAYPFGFVDRGNRSGRVAAMPMPPDDARYPALLGAIASPPILHVRGEIVSADALAIAIVGSRRPSAYGLHVAERLAFDLAARGVTIVSGLARGIDTAAHRGALAAGGRTIAVLGCGIDIVYPPENGRLMRQIETQGAVVSQFAPGTRPLAYNFPTRNRTTAGPALGA